MGVFFISVIARYEAIANCTGQIYMAALLPDIGIYRYFPFCHCEVRSNRKLYRANIHGRSASRYRYLSVFFLFVIARYEAIANCTGQIYMAALLPDIGIYRYF
jgi:hypothetical protein